MRLRNELEKQHDERGAPREGDFASMLRSQRMQEKLLFALSSEFGAFKAEELRQLKVLKEEAAAASRSAPSQVFNVSYPPFVIPLVSVHENASSKDKTINISGTPGGEPRSS